MWWSVADIPLEPTGKGKLIKDAKRLDSSATVLTNFVKDERVKDSKGGSQWQLQTVSQF